MRRVCPNCKGELVARPRRRPTDATIASTRSADEVIRANTVHQATWLKKPRRQGSPCAAARAGWHDQLALGRMRIPGDELERGFRENPSLLGRDWAIAACQCGRSHRVPENSPIRYFTAIDALLPRKLPESTTSPPWIGQR